MRQQERMRLRTLAYVGILALGVGSWGACKKNTNISIQEESLTKKIKHTCSKLRSLHKPFVVGSWASGPGRDEKNQSFQTYTSIDPIRPNKTLKSIYIQPLGPFSKVEDKLLRLTAEFVSLYFSTPVKIRKGWPLSILPARAKRVHPSWGVKQILTTYISKELLMKRRPKDAVAYIALTASDLWPGRGWNFVFGEAYIRKRVGVWSMARFGNPNKSPKSFRLALLRTLKTATHEIGHILSIDHCKAYQCNMGGSNSLTESDQQPLALCPQCLAKVCWSTRCDVKKRFQQLAHFSKKHGLKTEADFFLRSLKQLK